MYIGINSDDIPLIAQINCSLMNFTTPHFWGFLLKVEWKGQQHDQTLPCSTCFEDYNYIQLEVFAIITYCKFYILRTNKILLYLFTLQNMCAHSTRLWFLMDCFSSVGTMGCHRYLPFFSAKDLLPGRLPPVSAAWPGLLGQKKNTNELIFNVTSISSTLCLCAIFSWKHANVRRNSPVIGFSMVTTAHSL